MRHLKQSVPWLLVGCVLFFDNVPAFAAQPKEVVLVNGTSGPLSVSGNVAAPSTRASH